MKTSNGKNTVFTISVLIVISVWAIVVLNSTTIYQSLPSRITTIIPREPTTEKMPIEETPSPPPVPCTCSETEFVQRRLQVAESNWNRDNKKQQGVANEPAQSNGRIFWDLFYPSFDCPFTKERIGRVGDGGKWICGFDQLESKANCVVFSFGISTEASFEEEFLRRTQNCAVHMFDHTIIDPPALVAQYPGRAIFWPMGIGSADGESIVTLKSAMAMAKVDAVDVLKMDVEGSEWGSVPRMLKDFPKGLPFAQLAIEAHLVGTSGLEEWSKTLRKLWKRLESAGLRHFFQEPNLLNMGLPFTFRELCFLNTKMEPFRLPMAI